MKGFKASSNLFRVANDTCSSSHDKSYWVKQVVFLFVGMRGRNLTRSTRKASSDNAVRRITSGKVKSLFVRILVGAVAAVMYLGRLRNLMPNNSVVGAGLLWTVRWDKCRKDMQVSTNN